jgi:GNAT superfamily N-acetyltransferase
VAELSFHIADEADATRLADLRVRAMRESLERMGRFNESRARQRLLSDFTANRTTLLKVDGALAGFYVLREAANGWLLQHLYVEPRFQSQGIGARVLRRIFDGADHQRRTVRVGALKGSASNQFYRRHGFVEVRHTEFDIDYVRQPL